MERPADPPPTCPVCDTAYDCVSVHDAGLLVNLRDNARYRRVCVEPVAGPRVRFYHHTHEQVGADDGDRPAEHADVDAAGADAGGRERATDPADRPDGDDPVAGR